MASLMPDLQSRFYYTGSTKPLSLGKVYFYVAGSTVSAPTYSDNGVALNSNPVNLDIVGQTQVWLDSNYVYDIYIKDKDGVLQETRESVSVSNGGGAGPAGFFILKDTPLGVRQSVNTDLVNISSGSVTLETTHRIRDGQSTIMNTVTGAENTLATDLPSKGTVMLDGMNGAEVSSVITSVNNANLTKLPVVTSSERIGAANPLDGSSMRLNKKYNADLETFEMYDSIHGEADRFARLSDVQAPVIETVTDSPTIDMVLSGTNLSANVKVSSSLLNAIGVISDGLYVPEAIVKVVNDSTSIDFTLVSPSQTLTADLVVSPDAGNQLSVRSTGAYVPTPITSTKQTASLQFSKPGSINANSVISPPTDGSSWFGGNNMGYGTNSAKQFKVTNVASTLLRYVTNSAGSIQMRLAYIPQTPPNTLPYNAGNGTLIASWTSTIPNTSGADWYFFNFNNILNVTIPQGAIVFLEVTNKTATAIDGIACIVNLEEI